ncbi:hypothetical protein [Roseateles sp. LYH14W]|uniref:Uncharacterized protein n=1 Tax=Pelomonas parva TaxID=3299032 RepID=A0ABW7EWP8_9BURK
MGSTANTFVVPLLALAGGATRVSRDPGADVPGDFPGPNATSPRP